jgi:hypothetical protein
MPKALPEDGHGLADRALAHDAQHGAVQVVDGMVEEAELLGALPAAGQHVLAVGHEVAAQGQHQREHVLGHGVHGVVTDVGHGDAAHPAGGHVDAVVAGGGHGDHAQRRQLRQRRLAQLHLVDDGNRGAVQALHHLARRGGGVLDPVVVEAGPAQVRLQGVAVEEDDAVLHAVAPVRIRPGRPRGPSAAIQAPPRE